LYCKGAIYQEIGTQISEKLEVGQTMRDDYKPILRWALEASRMLLWLIYGIAIAVFLSCLFNLFPLIAPILVFISGGFWRLAVLVVLFLATAILIEAIG
jgi:polyferredoxin